MSFFPHSSGVLLTVSCFVPFSYHHPRDWEGVTAEFQGRVHPKTLTCFLFFCMLPLFLVLSNSSGSSIANSSKGKMFFLIQSYRPNVGAGDRCRSVQWAACVWWDEGPVFVLPHHPVDSFSLFTRICLFVLTLSWLDALPDLTPGAPGNFWHLPAKSLAEATQKQRVQLPFLSLPLLSIINTLVTKGPQRFDKPQPWLTISHNQPSVFILWEWCFLKKEKKNPIWNVF